MIEHGSVGRRGLVLATCGAAGLVLSFWGLARDVGWIAQPFYAWAWWSYILLVDGLVAWRRGSSFLTARRRLLSPILVWSVTFWFFFELLNLRFRNWYYVGVFDLRSWTGLVSGAVFGVACFATVFVGLFETYDAVSSSGLLRRARIAPRRWPWWVSWAVQGVGAVMVGLALVSPHYLAPLVWGSLTFLVDPWCYRRGARSLLGDVEAGDIGVVGRLLVAGLLCGFIWESFNYLAPQKWIYTVRGLEELKVFEMPVLGFLGFPALALDAFAAWAAIAYLFHGNATWEHPDDVTRAAPARATIGRRRFLLTLPLHVVFWATISILTETVNIGSVELHLGHLTMLPSGSEDALRDQRIHRPRQLLAALEEPGRAAVISAELGLNEAEWHTFVEELRLYTHKGIGYRHGRMLRQLGVATVDDLARADPVDLHRRMVERRAAVGARFPALRPSMVRVWVVAAR